MNISLDVDNQGVRIITPPLLKDKITLSSVENTNRWVFYGTRTEIIEWIKKHSHIQLENGLFPAMKPLSFNTHTELVIDLLSYSDPEQSMFDYLKSFIKTDFENEKVKIEIRPRIESKDQMIPTLCRIIVASGVTFGDILVELVQEWYQPSRTLIEQAKDILNNNPGPIHILSTDTPMQIQINDNINK
ncbi:uncharacterized protein BX663DRAFT_492783 [Cokeromyces recurvatus]|uniref:uncharacterized protein n=1 Tax=Cokeromyces recurvatus TaxID=90255 RepID=UPI00221F38EB|nr:uncharacterized protein BX663DRAFT_492783 [Cokeromyces recurvatus]KAI7908040.1 hypothetical protein BX663DRAFT_492783 [Cokeromyces recurvatus]